jgi:hypothetical protein
MSQLAPPTPPSHIAAGEGDHLRRLHFRLWQVFITVVTVLITGWCVTRGPVTALLSLLVAKHVLVAVLCMGMDLYPTEKKRPG